MLSTAEIQAHVAELTYKPGWRFTVYEGQWEGPHIVITTVVEDSYHPGESMTLDVHTSIPPIPSRDYLDIWLQWRLNRLESHESREFLRRNGRPVFDPHGQDADRDSFDYEPLQET